MLIAAPLFAAAPLELIVSGLRESAVSRTTAALTVSVKNTDTGEAVEFIGVSVERKGSDGKFSSVRPDIGCPCGAKCKKMPVSLKKGESIRATWDMMSNQCQKVPSGVYRFVVINRYSEASNDYVYSGISKEFIVFD
jgi:hypothetical protein